MTSELSSLCSYAKGKVSVDTLSKRNYVSTENMMPNKGGIVDAGALPSAQYTQQYIKDDILVSNIRPYFVFVNKKVLQKGVKKVSTFNTQ